MTQATLTALSPLDGRYHDKLTALRPIFSEYGLIKYRVIVEIRWLQFLATHAHLPELPALTSDAQEFLNQLMQRFSEYDALRVKEIEKTINHDVKSMEYFLKEKISHHAELVAACEFIHFGCTSEDINNLAYAMLLQTARTECLLPTLNQLLEALQQFAHEYADLPMLARTHGQAATPTTVGKEFANIAARLSRQLIQLANTPLLGKFNGATGNYSALLAGYPTLDWSSLNEKFVTELGLTWNPYTTQIEPHDYLAEMFGILIRINTILMDLNRDMWSYISIHYFQQKTIEKEVGSSTMPHKVNPIDFENAEGNLGLANALFEHMAVKLPISRWQRDLSDSTVLRNVGVAMGYALLAYQSTLRGLSKVTPQVDVLVADLNQHWEVLAEPIQTVMRRYGIPQPYEQLKNFTRGKEITRDILQAFIENLSLPAEVKQQLLALTPQNYLGFAERLAKEI